MALPINKAIQEPTKVLWQTPSSLMPPPFPPAERSALPLQESEHFYTPSPVGGHWWFQLQASKHKQASTPKAKDAMKRYLFGRKRYSAAGLQFRIANQQALLGCYDFNLWDSILKLKDG